jgi:cytochrome c-type biogenesis protein CcmH
VTRRTSFWALVFLLVLALPSAGFAQLAPEQAARAKSLGKRVKCECGGCNDAAGSCYHSGGAFSGPCDFALNMLKEIEPMVARNDSDDQILKAFLGEYGPTVLIEPPKSGFNLTAWIMPFAAPLIAFFAVWETVRRWRRRAAVAPAGNTKVPAELLARAQREAREIADE